MRHFVKILGTLNHLQRNPFKRKSTIGLGDALPGAGCRGLGSEISVVLRTETPNPNPEPSFPRIFNPKPELQNAKSSFLKCKPSTPTPVPDPEPLHPYQTGFSSKGMKISRRQTFSSCGAPMIRS
jgi:hypothetical protein